MAYYEKAIGEAFNLATGREIKIRDLANWVLELTKNDSGIILAERRDWDKKNRLLASIEKARRILGYNPNMDFKEGLKQVKKWFDENWGNIERVQDSKANQLERAINSSGCS